MQGISTHRFDLLVELTEALRESQRTTEAVDEAVNRLLGLGRSDVRCLDLLEEQGPVPAGAVAGATGLTTGAVTAMIDRLEHSGFVRRRTDPGDRRRVIVEATPAVREKTAQVYDRLAGAAEPLLERYSDAQLRLLVDFHRRSAAMQRENLERLGAIDIDGSRELPET